ncbi:MAG: glycosyltransferase [Chloroflexi bacterium]|nr:glycosyltransferase [Chloroflexota bacterium]
MPIQNQTEKTINYPLISIITAVRNGAPYVGALIESVLNQDYSNVEHIVIDDGSNDEGATEAILERYPHLRWWSRENKGQYATQNEGLLAARGDIIGIISADDVYITPNTLSRVVEYWRTHASCNLVYGKTLHMDQQGILLPYQTDTTGNYPAWFLKYNPYIQHCSLFVSRDFILRNDIWFDASFRYAGDWDWIMRLFRSDPQYGYLPYPLSVIRDHPHQISRTALGKAIIAEHVRVCRIHGGSYPLHFLVRKLLQYRAMFIKAWSTFRKQGVRGFFDLGKDWLYRRKIIRG